MVEILFFAWIGDKAGESRIKASVDGYSVQEVKSWVEMKYQLGTGALSKTMTAINEEFSENDDRVQHGDTLALIPPVSGG